MNDPFANYLEVVDSVYGVYLDSTAAYRWAKERFEQAQHDGLRLFEAQGEQLTIEDLDQRQLHFGKGDPNEQGAKFLHSCSQGEYKSRNAPGGRNHQIIGNLCAVLIYQYWEDSYRALIADQLDLSPSDLQVDIMGDLRQIRRSVIHNQAVAIDDMSRCKVLKWFDPGDVIFISEDQFEQLIYHVKKAINELSTDGSRPA